jgi:hypothetical protein
MEHQMAEHRTDPSLDDFNRGLLILSSALVGVGTLLSLAGFAVSGAAILGALKTWSKRANLSPKQLAKLKWDQTKVVAEAMAGAWLNAETYEYPVSTTT